MHNELFDAAASEQAMTQNAAALKDLGGNYYRWTLSMFPLEKGKRILDLGCGPCLYLKEILGCSPEAYVATDYSENYVHAANELLRNRPNCSAHRLDLLSETVPDAVGEQQFDCVFCFDVLEHIRDHRAALANVRKIMTVTGARFLFLRVPAVQAIYGENDRAIGHFRRYSARGMRELLHECSLDVGRIRYQNFVGIFPWYWIGRIAKRSTAVSSGEGRAFDRIVPLLRFFEKMIPPPVGLSLCATCQTG